MTELGEIEKSLKTMLKASAQLWLSNKPSLDGYYEAYLWAESLDAAKRNGWAVTYKDAGSNNNQFRFRLGPGLFSSKASYSYAVLTHSLNQDVELHIGIRVCGKSDVLHEFDIVGISGIDATAARVGESEPHYTATLLHIEAKYHKSDLTLGIGREMVGLKYDCPSIHPFLVSRREGSGKIRSLMKFHNGTYVHNGFMTDTGIGYLRSCLDAAIRRWP